MTTTTADVEDIEDYTTYNGKNVRRCLAIGAKGTQCTRPADLSVWCHKFQEWENAPIPAAISGTYTTGPSWWSVCSWHAHVPEGWVSSIDLKRYKR